MLRETNIAAAVCCSAGFGLGQSVIIAPELPGDSPAGPPLRPARPIECQHRLDELPRGAVSVLVDVMRDQHRGAVDHTVPPRNDDLGPPGDERAAGPPAPQAPAHSAGVV